MGKFTHIMIHCTDTPSGREVSKEDLEQWHIKERGWSRLGYAGIWHLDGEFEVLTPFDEDGEIESWEITNGARGWNGRTRHFVYSGGGNNVDTRTVYQLAKMRSTLIQELHYNPAIKIIGHNQVSSKYCPSFDVPKWCEIIRIPKENIDYATYY